MPTTSIIQVMPATAQPIDMSIRMMAHIMMKALLVVKVDMVKAAKLAMALNNIVMIVALSDSLLEVMAMPDSNSYNNSKEFKTAFCTEIHMHITDQFSNRSLVPGVP